MKIGFFINGPDTNGLPRASRILATGLATLKGCEVTVVQSTDPNPADCGALSAPLQHTDVVVAHASARTKGIWGAPLRRGEALAAFASGLGPPLVVHLHDVYGETQRTAILAEAARCLGSVTVPRRLRRHGDNLMRLMMRRAEPAEAMLVRYVDECAAGFLVSNDLERAALRRHQPHKPVEVVPHFVEQRRSLTDKDEAKAQLGFTGRRIVTLLGFIHARKGHDLALSVLERLPSDSLLVFAGAPADGAGPFAEGVMRRSEEMGLKGRLHVTGYLNEDALDLHLSATDVAICPFSEVSASGSVATWFAAGKPIVATDLPLFRMYKKEFGDGVLLAAKGDANAFARLVLNASAASGALEAQIRETASHYSIGNTATRMADALCRIVKCHQQPVVTGS